jgi:uncharacterized repeat protein (TIGR01451 family)
MSLSQHSRVLVLAAGLVGLAGSASAQSTISKAYNFNDIVRNAQVTLTFTVTGPLAAGWKVNDQLETGLVAVNAPAPSILCTSMALPTTLPTISGGGVSLNYDTGPVLIAGESCTITYTIQANAPKGPTPPYLNTVQLTDSANVQLAADTASLIVREAGFTKTFNVPKIQIGGTAEMTFTITNPTLGGYVMDLAGFGDPLPVGFTVSNPLVGSVTNCGPNLSLANLTTAGGTTFTVPNLAQVVNGVPCVIKVNVVGSQGTGDSGVNNTANGTGLLAGVQSTQANIKVGPPELSKSFNPQAVGRNGLTTMTIKIVNDTNNPITGLQFTDQLGPKLTATTPGSFPFTCAPGANSVTGTVTAAAVNMTGGSMAAGATCTLDVQIRATDFPVSSTVNSITNIIDGLGNLGTIINGVPTFQRRSAVLYVVTPVFTKTAGTTPILVGGTSSYTITINNNSGTQLAAIPLPGIPLNLLSFTDTLPAPGVTVGSVVSTCPAPANTIVPGGGSFTVPNFTLVDGASCTITVPITGTTAGAKVNTVTGDAGGNLQGITRSATVTVGRDLLFSKVFNPAIIQINDKATLLFTITNPDGVAVNNLNFTDVLPPGLTFDPAPAPTNTCGGSFPGGGIPGTLKLNGGSMAAGMTTCIITVTVKGIAPGTWNNHAVGDTGPLNGKPADDLIVVVQPNFTKEFTPSIVGKNVVTTLKFNISNPSNSTITNIGFTDTFPPNLLFDSMTPTFNDCPSAMVATDATPGNISINVTGITLGPSPASCMITFAVRSPAVGVVNNQAMGTGTLVNINPTSTLTVPPELTLTKTFSPSSINVNNTTTLTLTVFNGTGATLANLDFTDTMPAGLTVVGAPTLSAACAPGVISGTPAAINLDNAQLLDGETCTITATVKGITAGVWVNTVNGPAGSDLAGKTSSSTLTVLGQITFSKAFNPSTIVVGDTSLLTLTINNQSGATLTNAAFNDPLPFDVRVDSLISNIGCGATPTAVAGSTSITLSPPTNIPNNSSCVIVVRVRAFNTGVKDNIATGSAGLAGKEAKATLTVLAPGFSKSFSPGAITFTPPSTTVRLTWKITNTNPSGPNVPAGFVDNLPTAVGNPGFAMTVAGNGNPTYSADCGPGTFSVVFVGGETSVTFQNASIPATKTCIVMLDVKVPGIGFYHNVAVGRDFVNGVEAPADLDVAPPARKAYQLHYFSNLTAGDSVITLTNDGASSTMGTALTAQNGNLCINTYTYSPDEQLISCCSCAITPNALATLSVVKDLTFNPLTPIVPTSVVVKLLATRQGSSCNAAAVSRTDLRSGMEAWGATLHEAPVPLGGLKKYGLTETRFVPGELTDAELTRMTGLCSFIQANGSGYGVCKSCRVAGLGASSK